MKGRLKSIYWGAILYTGFVGLVCGQTTNQTLKSAPSIPPQASPVEATLQAFLDEQDALLQERESLWAKGATAEQLHAWRDKNAARIAAQQKRAEALASASAVQPLPTNSAAHIPPDASPTLAAFLTTRASLQNARAHIHNQLVAQAASSRQGLTSAKLSQMEQQASKLFHQQHASQLQLQDQRLLALAAESARESNPAPAMGTMPRNASPQLTAYLSMRDQLIRKRQQLKSQYANADPATLQAALQNWRQQNAARLQQQQQLAQALTDSSQATATNQN